MEKLLNSDDYLSFTIAGPIAIWGFYIYFFDYSWPMGLKVQELKT